MRHDPPLRPLRHAQILRLALSLPLALIMAGFGNLIVPSARADVIELRANPWCPFNCTPGSAAPGFMVELTREALAPFGHEVRYAQLNWSRSLAQVRSGEITGIIGTDADEAPGLVFSPALGQYQEVLGFRRGERRDIARISELAGLRLGALQDYEYNSDVLEHIAARSAEPGEIQLLSGDDALARNLRKLLAGRIDVLVADRIALMHQLHEMGLQDQVELLPHPESSTLHIGFSPKHPQAALYVAQMEQGLAELRRSGRYQAILARYGLKE